MFNYQEFERAYRERLRTEVHHFERVQNTANTDQLPLIKPIPLLDVFSQGEQIIAKMSDITRYREFWISSNRDIEVLNTLLEKMTVVTRSLEDKAFENCASALIEIAAAKEPIVVVGGGGRGYLKLFSHPSVKNVLDKNPHILALSQVYSSEIGQPETINEVVRHMDSGSRAHLIFIDDWSFTGAKYDQQTESLFGGLEYLRMYRDIPPFEKSVIIGGITSKALQGFRASGNTVHAYYQIPLMYQMYSSEQYRSFLSEVFKGKDSEELFYITNYSYKGLTISYDRIPDSWCIPDFVGSYGLKDAEDKRQVLFPYTRGRL